MRMSNRVTTLRMRCRQMIRPPRRDPAGRRVGRRQPVLEPVACRRPPWSPLLAVIAARSLRHRRPGSPSMRTPCQSQHPLPAGGGHTRYTDRSEAGMSCGLVPRRPAGTIAKGLCLCSPPRCSLLVSIATAHCAVELRVAAYRDGVKMNRPPESGHLGPADRGHLTSRVQRSQTLTCFPPAVVNPHLQTAVAKLTESRLLEQAAAGWSESQLPRVSDKCRRFRFLNLIRQLREGLASCGCSAT